MFLMSKRCFATFRSRVLRSLNKFCNRYRTCGSSLLAFAFNSINLMQRARSQITLTATWATNDRHILDHEQQITFAITTRNMPNPCAWLATVVTDPQVF